MRLHYTTEDGVCNTIKVPENVVISVKEKDGKTYLWFGGEWEIIQEPKAKILRQLGWPEEEQEEEPVTLSPVEWHFEPQPTGAVHRVLTVGGREVARMWPCGSSVGIPGPRYICNKLSGTHTAAEAVEALQKILEGITVPPVPEYQRDATPAPSDAASRILHLERCLRVEQGCDYVGDCPIPGMDGWTHLSTHWVNGRYTVESNRWWAVNEGARKCASAYDGILAANAAMGAA
jgi:hypothetical protein